MRIKARLHRAHFLDCGRHGAPGFERGARDGVAGHDGAARYEFAQVGVAGFDFRAEVRSITLARPNEHVAVHDVEENVGKEFVAVAGVAHALGAFLGGTGRAEEAIGDRSPAFVGDARVDRAV